MTASACPARWATWRRSSRRSRRRSAANVLRRAVVAVAACQVAATLAASASAAPGFPSDAQLMQHPRDDEHPAVGMGPWLGFYPARETIGAQLASLVFVLGSYFVARELQRGRRGRAGSQLAPLGRRA